MRARRVVLSVSAAIAALVLSSCGASPYLPPTVTVASPFVSSTTPFVDGISGIGRQQARVRVCSLGGGPLTVDVDSPGADDGTELTVRAISADAKTTGDTAAATLIEVTYPRGSATSEAQVESNRPLRPGECADVMVFGTYNMFSPGPTIYYTVIW